MEEELAGRGSRRRRAQNDASPAPSQRLEVLSVRPRANAPTEFNGSSLAELRNHIQTCSVYFRAIGLEDGQAQVDTAASYLRGTALSEWNRRATLPTTWKTYENALRDIVEDPDNRTGNALFTVKIAT